MLIVRLNWQYLQDPLKIEQGFIVSRKAFVNGVWDASFTEIARVGAGILTYDDATVVAGTTYGYQVASYSYQSVSAPTSMVSVAANAPTPNAPTALTAQVLVMP